MCFLLLVAFFLCFLSGCYLVRPIKPTCSSRIKSRNETTTFRRTPGVLVVDKESKLTTVRTNVKNGNHTQRGDPIECQL